MSGHMIGGAEENHEKRQNSWVLKGSDDGI
jgi:hypothetical protein